MKRFYAKTCWWCIATLCAVVFAFSAAFAEVISEHVRQDMGIQKAMHLCKEKGGDISWSQTEKYQLHDDPDGYRLYGDQLLFVCKIEQASGKSRWLLKWPSPTTRADCSPLLPEEIAGYLFRINGTDAFMTSANEYITEPTESIEGLTIATVDKNGRESVAVPFGQAHHSPC